MLGSLKSYGPQFPSRCSFSRRSSRSQRGVNAFSRPLLAFLDSCLQKDSRARNVYASTSIEGNPLTLVQVQALEEGRELASADMLSTLKVLNYLEGLRYIENRAERKMIRHNNLFELHQILAKHAMDHGETGRSMVTPTSQSERF